MRVVVAVFNLRVTKQKCILNKRLLQFWRFRSKIQTLLQPLLGTYLIWSIACTSDFRTRPTFTAVNFCLPTKVVTSTLWRASIRAVNLSNLPRRRRSNNQKRSCCKSMKFCQSPRPSFKKKSARLISRSSTKSWSTTEQEGSISSTTIKWFINPN